MASETPRKPEVLGIVPQRVSYSDLSSDTSVSSRSYCSEQDLSRWLSEKIDLDRETESEPPGMMGSQRYKAKEVKHLGPKTAQLKRKKRSLCMHPLPTYLAELAQAPLEL